MSRCNQKWAVARERVWDKPAVRNEITHQVLEVPLDAISVVLPDRDYVVLSVTCPAG